ncbi:unnamed protein product [Tetraodon nigroviridis]|uniref:(spotted green pufferfish) hypothetical protein n=1 Tax=Tetraodon nigroviridis TaxID=99883 RepID=Q4TGH7_TETNG|nr:unnamed protein product [Tetraodon nigroviridis]
MQLNLSDVAERHGYKTFYKLLEDSGVLDLLKEEVHQPLTLLLPSDQALDSLPPEQKNFLFHRENRPQLLEYLKFHVLPAQKVYAEDLVHLASPRTLQGSPLSFRCGGTDAVGEIFVNDGACRIVQRHLGFPGGMAFGIDCLLTPPSLGGRCDVQTTFDFSVRWVLAEEVQKCDLPSVYIARNSGCRSICAVSVWQSRCCHGYYGRDCLACPGGAGSPCSNHGNCDDGHLGNGTCACDPGFGGVACELCSDGFYAPPVKPATVPNTGHVTADAAEQGRVSATPAGGADAVKVRETSCLGARRPARPTPSVRTTTPACVAPSTRGADSPARVSGAGGGVRRGRRPQLMWCLQGRTGVR